MDIRELKIGNYVFFNNKEIGIISGVQDFFINNGKIAINGRLDVFYNIENIKPVKLTESRLSKILGYSFKEGITYLYTEKQPIITIYKKQKTFKVIKDISGLKSEIKYVHKFQNLFYELQN